MRSAFVALLVAAIALGLMACEEEEEEAATPTPTATATPKITRTATPSATPGTTPTPQPTPEETEGPAPTEQAAEAPVAPPLESTPPLPRATPPPGATPPLPPTLPPGDTLPVGGECPPDYPIKGIVSSGGKLVYHVPGTAFYDRADPEVCFATQADAQAAGYRPWPTGPTPPPPLPSPPPTAPPPTAPPPTEETTEPPPSGSTLPVGSECPTGYPIKGNVSSSDELIYHVPGSELYDQTDPEECFMIEAGAQAAGYRRSQS